MRDFLLIEVVLSGYYVKIWVHEGNLKLQVSFYRLGASTALVLQIFELVEVF